MKLIDSVWKLLAILVLTALFVFLIGICICFLSETLCLRAHQYEIILTFVGIIGTFVVVTNFQQAQECKELAKKEIEGIKKNAQKQIEELVATQKLMSDFVLTSKEYIVANKIIQQNNLPCNERAIWYLEYESNRNGYGFEKVEVKIKSVSLFFIRKASPGKTFITPAISTKSFSIIITSSFILTSSQLLQSKEEL